MIRPGKVALARPVDGLLSVSGCLAVPLMIVRYVLRRLWRKIIYIFAVKDATQALTEYWHRAFLIDHMVCAGHLDASADRKLAIRVFRHVLDQIDPSPLTGLARQTMANARHVFRLMIRARRLGATEVTRSLGDALSSHWRVAASAMQSTADLYDGFYEAEVERCGDASRGVE